jgi:hypothetical protein
LADGACCWQCCPCLSPPERVCHCECDSF